MKRLDVKKGYTYNNLKIIKEVDGSDNGKKRRRFLCKCDCGNKTVVLLDTLRTGHTKSCGCRRGEVHESSSTRQYRIWQGIKRRCYYKKGEDYPRYGGRGIKVCDRWKYSFSNFWNDMNDGYKQDLSLDRINNDGDYCKENCKWSTNTEQSRNRRGNIFVSINGVKISFTELSEFFGIRTQKLYDRIFILNWDIKKAIIK